MADWLAHGRDWQADTRSGRRYCLERPLCEVQLTKSCDWAGLLLERLLTPVRTNDADPRETYESPVNALMAHARVTRQSLVYHLGNASPE